MAHPQRSALMVLGETDHEGAELGGRTRSIYVGLELPGWSGSLSSLCVSDFVVLVSVKTRG